MYRRPFGFASFHLFVLRLGCAAASAEGVVDISAYGAGLHLAPVAPAAQLVQAGGVTVATGETAIDDAVVFGLIEAGRR